MYIAPFFHKNITEIDKIHRLFMKNPNFRQDYQEWLEALENTILTDGEEYTSELLEKLYQEAKVKGLDVEDILIPLLKTL